MVSNLRCEHCNGNLIKEDNELVCLQCGRRPLHPAVASGPFSKGWKSLGYKARRDWYDCHRKEIEETFKKLKAAGVRREWGISYTTLVGLLTRWGKVEPKPKEPPPIEPDNVRSAVEIRLVLDVLESLKLTFDSYRVEGFLDALRWVLHLEDR